MQAVCVTRGSEAGCFGPLQVAWADVDAQISDVAPSTFEMRILMPILYRFATVISSLNNRSCGGPDLCFRDALAPIIASRGDFPSIRAMIKSMQQHFFAFDPELRRTNLQLSKELFLTQLQRCGLRKASELGNSEFLPTICLDESRPMLNIVNKVMSFKPWDWFKDEDLMEMQSLFDSCWFSCTLPLVSIWSAQETILSRKYVLYRFLPAALVELCESDNCVSAALAEVQDITEVSMLVQSFIPRVVDKLVWVLGLVVTSLLLLSCVALIVTVVFVWKIAQRVRFQLVLVIMLIVSLVCQVVFWALQHDFFSRASLVLSLFTVFSTATPFVFMAKDWTIAFVFLLSGKGFRLKTKLHFCKSRTNRAEREAGPGVHCCNHRLHSGVVFGCSRSGNRVCCD